MINSAAAVKIRKHGFNTLMNVLRWAFFGLIAFVVLYPLFTETVSMFMTVEDVHDMSVRYIPKNFTTENIKNAWNLIGLGTVYPVTLQYTAVAALLQTASCTFVGYGLARFKFALNKPLTILCIIGLALPPDLLQIPLYNFFRNFNLFGIIPALNNGDPISFIDTQVPGIVLSALAAGFRCGLYILIMRQFFNGMPKEIEEAASIDGSGHFGVFFKVMIPGALTMMVTIFLFSFVWTWIDIDFSGIFMKNYEILSVNVRTMNSLPGGAAVADQVTLNLQSYAGIIYLVIPLLILYLFTQRFFVESVERSGLVG